MLERVIASRACDVGRALRALDDVLSGLQAMHSVGVGHLDLKPSNVVQRQGQDAVLVDFGLAGRHIRPGCATGPYGAPEVWGVSPDDAPPNPKTADVYAFGCLAYEALTGRVLFQADSEIAQISLHVSHDGLPGPIKALGARQELAGLSELLFATLRHDPRKRPTVASLRDELHRLAPRLSHLPWPVD
jgi:serine/threonine protein kinase